jgi:hypothetical protein
MSKCTLHPCPETKHDADQVALLSVPFAHLLAKDGKRVLAHGVRFIVIGGDRNMPWQVTLEAYSPYIIKQSHGRGMTLLRL